MLMYSTIAVDSFVEKYWTTLLTHESNWDFLYLAII